ncbi:hypothetical protein DCS_05915 [Drechmeria coniospora]|uniref:deuterolysin n=1 Tax=Drechmeria coniospora TaxID=98403 RepID=A0A151GA53_DRECN|nr:hypothetical protein DCS_05915 [Drechmeria coniospora]KYK53966.1 hypothetical protein DCS_05915 [Drechmeria coniospora]ODA78199.1 hypothetical protein RJ55_05579 [Drechmeria coniospora]
MASLPLLLSLWALTATAAPAIKDGRVAARSQISPSCGNNVWVRNSLKQCASLARTAAATAMNTSSTLMKDFFKFEDERSRKFVSEVYAMIAEECESEGQGLVTINCDESRQPQGCTWAAGITQGHEVTLCHGFFINGDNRSPRCGGIDAGNTMLHEMTHALNGTKDLSQFAPSNSLGGYGLNFIFSLNGENNLIHADTYSQFAQAADLSCSEQDLRDRAQKTPGEGAVHGAGTSRDRDADESEAPPARTPGTGPGRSLQTPGSNRNDPFQGQTPSIPAQSGQAPPRNTMDQNLQGTGQFSQGQFNGGAGTATTAPVQPQDLGGMLSSAVSAGLRFLGG